MKYVETNILSLPMKSYERRTASRSFIVYGTKNVLNPVRSQTKRYTKSSKNTLNPDNNHLIVHWSRLNLTTYWLSLKTVGIVCVFSTSFLKFTSIQEI